MAHQHNPSFASVLCSWVVLTFKDPKDPDGKVLTLQQVTPVKDENDKIIPNAYHDAAGRPVEAMDFEFDRTIQGNPEDDDAHFFTDVGVARKEGSWFSHNVYEGRDVKGLGIRDQINEVANGRRSGRTASRALRSGT